MTKGNPEEKLRELLQKDLHSSYRLSSRAHKMQKIPGYVKRDDELGFGVSGSKLRKYASLIPLLKGKKAGLVGSARSNHILSLIQLLKQEGIEYGVFLEKPKTDLQAGNFFFTSLLLSPEEIFWVDKAPSKLTPEVIRHFEEIANDTFFWVPPGANMKECLPGSLSLSLDILENERELGVSFEEIFVDAGTGATASALILGLAYLKKHVPVTVVLTAGTEETFLEELNLFKEAAEEYLGESLFLSDYRPVFPTTAKSFGCSNRKVFETIAKVAREEGMFLDPIYTAKLYLRFAENPGEKALWIHSGGALSLTGFQKQIL